MDGAEYCRGYVQNWLQGGTIPERNEHGCGRIRSAHYPHPQLETQTLTLTVGHEFRLIEQ